MGTVAKFERKVKFCDLLFKKNDYNSSFKEVCKFELRSTTMASNVLNFLSSRYIIFDRQALKEEDFFLLENIWAKKLSFQDFSSKVKFEIF